MCLKHTPDLIVSNSTNGLHPRPPCLVFFPISLWLTLSLPQIQVWFCSLYLVDVAGIHLLLPPPLATTICATLSFALNISMSQLVSPQPFDLFFALLAMAFSRKCQCCGNGHGTLLPNILQWLATALGIKHKQGLLRGRQPLQGTHLPMSISCHYSLYQQATRVFVQLLRPSHRLHIHSPCPLCYLIYSLSPGSASLLLDLSSTDRS